MVGFMIDANISDPLLAAGIFGMGIPEMAVIGLIALVVFGPKKLPELGSSIGQAIKGFKKEMDNPTPDEEPEAAAPEPAESTKS